MWVSNGSSIALARVCTAAFLRASRSRPIEALVGESRSRALSALRFPRKPSHTNALTTRWNSAPIKLPHGSFKWSRAAAIYSAFALLMHLNSVGCGGFTIVILPSGPDSCLNAIAKHPSVTKGS
eukprot:1609914-Pyramimonas_sp.AAC.1